MSRITEQRDVQNQLINYLKGIQWTFIGRYDLPAWRGDNEREPFLVDVLRRQLGKLNGWAGGDNRLDEVVRRLRLIRPSLEGNEQFLLALRGNWTVYDASVQREHNVTLIDFTDLKANEFHFTEEVWFQDRDRRRMDMVLYINGLPVIVVENKSPRLEDPGLEGFKQVQETYTQMIPEFIKFPIPFAVCASRLEYGATWNSDLKAFYKWKVQDKDYGLENLSKSFFDREMVLKLLRDYTLFYRIDDILQKFLLRPHQIRVVEKIVERSVEAQSDAAASQIGLESHTQGSGKTLSMIVAAKLLRRHSTMKNPTILFVIDRLELEQQMLQNLEASGVDAIRARNKEHLRELLEKDTRGVIVTTIHKFDGMKRDVLTSRNVVVLIDEAHRSQEGNLGIYLRAALPNALQFGFTGTPIDRGKVGKGTYELFGSKNDPDGVHDEYSLNESIEDGTTLRLYYSLAPTTVWVDKLKLEGQFQELLDEFWRMVDEEGAPTQEALSALLARADKLLAVLKAPSRIAAIAEHIASHYQENILPLGFKALVVTPDREACALYKEALNQYLPETWTVPVYSQDPKKDTDLMKKYYLDEDQEKAVRKAFRDPTKEPKILIVTQKLLTGYDAPVAYAMYLDKPLKDHTLLQAIARVNRPYPNKKSGLVIDYIGIFKNLQRALSGNQDKVSRGLIDYETLKPRFAQLYRQVEAALAPIEPDKVDGRTERIIDYFWDEEQRERFFGQFKELEMVYEILSPDPFLYDYIDGYAAIADIYQTTRSYFDPNSEKRRLTRELLNKTEELIREHVSATPVAAPMPLYPINRNLADVIAQDQVSEQVKVINLQRSIIAHIESHKDEQPYLISIGEEVEQVIEALRQQQISVRTALERMDVQSQRMVQAEEEKAESKLDKLPFALRMVLRGAGIAPQAVGAIDQIANEMADYLNRNASWQHNSRLEQQVRTELYRRLLPHMSKPVNPNTVKAVVDELLNMHKFTF